MSTRYTVTTVAGYGNYPGRIVFPVIATRTLAESTVRRRISAMRAAHTADVYSRMVDRTDNGGVRTVYRSYPRNGAECIDVLIITEVTE